MSQNETINDDIFHILSEKIIPIQIESFHKKSMCLSFWNVFYALNMVYVFLCLM